MSKPMFKAGLKSQGKFLVKMISMSLTILLDQEKFVETMTKLAEVHNNRGVKAIEYGIVGDVLFWSLRKCLGPDYDSATHSAWVKIFCSMLKVSGVASY
jgi:hemoglobin-like flavoprotein